MSLSIERRARALCTSGLSLALLALFVGSSAACSADSTDSPGSDDTKHEPAGKADGGAEPPRPVDTPAKKDGSADPDETKDSSAPTVDKTVRMEMSIDGEAIEVENIEIEVLREDDGSARSVKLDLTYTQIDPMGYSNSESTLTLWTTPDESVGLCPDDARAALYVYKDYDDRQLYWLGTAYQDGNCSMKVTAGVADDFTAGTVRGTLDGHTSKSFSVTWGQPLPAAD